MLVKAILVHSVIGYKFCWLLPEDQNQGTPAGHESNGTTVRDHWEDMNQLRHQLGTYQTRESPMVQRVWSLRHRGYKRLRVCSFLVISFWIDKKIKCSLLLPIAKENTEKGGALYNLRRSVLLQQKQNELKFVCSLFGDEDMIWILDTYILSLNFGWSWRIKTITIGIRALLRFHFHQNTL